MDARKFHYCVSIHHKLILAFALAWQKKNLSPLLQISNPTYSPFPKEFKMR
jgi:hypothetical protein